MTLKHVTDVSVADWFVDNDGDEWAKVALGPSCFESYARVLYRLDSDAPADSDTTVRADVRDVLARFTSTPDECYFGLWDGTGDLGGGRWKVLDTATRKVSWGMSYPAAFANSVLHGPKVKTPYRDYLLFAGALAPPIDWGAADKGAGSPRGDMNGPHLMWPADHAWFMANDVDHRLGVGGSEALILELLADTRFEAIRTTYGPHQSEYR